MNHINDIRPDPDELLASLLKDEEKIKRGKLKIFFGMCAGVGKTYSMLQTARSEKFKGVDIIIGYVEAHNRRETMDLTEGLEITPSKKYEYKSTLVAEMDLDAVLARHPGVVLVDELAHTNAPGSRHLKRYQDVLEILDNGIDVYTTLNVQHLESRSETVSQITGVIIRETVPDDIFENSDEVELVDLSTEELLQRFSEGKVYTQERSREAVENFFRKGNITALREMALRIVADRVDKQLHDYLQRKQIRGPWKTGLHFLVAIDYRSRSTRLLRWAKNLSYSMGAQIHAIYVETAHKLTEKESEQLDKNISIAKQLGIMVRFKTNDDVVKAIVDHAQKENITHIIVGKPRVRNVLSMLRMESFINRLLRYSGNIDVYILGYDFNPRNKLRISMPPFSSGLSQYASVIFYILFSSLLLYAVKNYIGYQIVSFGLLFLVSILAIFYGTGPILLAATSSALIWDYFFIPPPYTLHIDKAEDIFMLLMFFIIALLNGILTSRIRRQEKRIRMREERTEALYQLTRELNNVSVISDVSLVASNFVKKHFHIDCKIMLKNEVNQLDESAFGDIQTHITENELSIATWVFRHSSKAGKNTDTLPSSQYTYYPLTGNSGNIGVIAVRQPTTFTLGEEQFWEACLSQISGKFEREFLRNAAKNAYVLNESDKLYKTLFNSISHELRIPVTTIMGASDTLMSQEYPEATRNKLYSEINIASLRLNRLINNLLNMSRLESGRITPNLDWHDIHDLVNSVVDSLKNELSPFKMTVIIPVDMPLVYIDFGLIEQVLYNLLLNATQHSPEKSQIRLKVYMDVEILTIQVMDRGTGFLENELSSVFNKFYRGSDSKVGGTGLGLSIAKGFIEAHSGTINAENRKNGGALFTIRIPVKIADIN
jgi:two-component system sensor histidine kinase KdpD